jgi:hypothetical protein
MILLWGLCSLWVTAFAGDPEAMFRTANEAYAEAEFDEAREGFAALVAQGQITGPVLYNLGNSYLQSGDLGRAVASYRHAERMWPRSQALAQNLSFARSSSKAMVAPVEAHPLVRWLFGWRFLLSASELRWLFIGVNALFWFSVLGMVFRPRSGHSRWVVATCAVPFLWVGLNLFSALLMPARVGVVLVDATRGYTQPDAVGAVEFVAREGTEVWGSHHPGEWVFVELSDGRSGWVHAADLALLSL